MRRIWYISYTKLALKMKCVEFGTFPTQTRAENEMRRIWYIFYTKLGMKMKCVEFGTFSTQH